MRLILSGRHPRNSTYTNSETGQVLYKVDKPLKLGYGTATIRKAVGTVGGVWHGESGANLSPGRSLPRRSSDRESSMDVQNNRDSDLISEVGREDGNRRSSVDETFIDSDVEDVDDQEGDSGTRRVKLEGHFAFYAQIEFKTFLSSRFRFDGRDVSAGEYFRKEGWSWYGRGRVFKARDGKEYRWELRSASLVMITNDTNKRELVRYRRYRPGLGPLVKNREACLEIDPRCPDEIMDEVIMTFVYCHKLKKDRERQTWSDAAGQLMRNQ